MCCTCGCSGRSRCLEQAADRKGTSEAGKIGGRRKSRETDKKALKEAEKKEKEIEKEVQEKVQSEEEAKISVTPTPAEKEVRSRAGGDFVLGRRSSDAG